MTVREPDVRFGKPDVFMSGFQTSGFRTSEDHYISPVIGRLLYLKRPITGRYKNRTSENRTLYPVFRRF